MKKRTPWNVVTLFIWSASTALYVLSSLSLSSHCCFFLLILEVNGQFNDLIVLKISESRFIEKVCPLCTLPISSNIRKEITIQYVFPNQFVTFSHNNKNEKREEGFEKEGKFCYLSSSFCWCVLEQRRNTKHKNA
jgi:hypothetical protein